MIERRRAPRIRIFKRAKIVLDSSFRDCIVQEISTIGARLEFSSTTHIPDIFDLTLDAGHTLRACRIAWRTSTHIGVEFQGASLQSVA